MKLYITETSPYARMVRIVLRELALEDRVEEVIAQTRTSDSPYYKINPSGRIPFLICPDGLCLEGSALICEYLDHLDGAPLLDRPKGAERWEFLRLEELARSLMDGLSVWGREIKRPQADQSETILQHEAGRARRLLDQWEGHIKHPLLSQDLTMIGLTLACALGMEARLPGFSFQGNYPELTAWFEVFAARQSFQETAVSRS